MFALPGPTWTAFDGHDVLISPSQRLMRIIRKPNTHPLYLPVSLVNMWVLCFFLILHAVFEFFQQVSGQNERVEERLQTRAVASCECRIAHHVLMSGGA